MTAHQPSSLELQALAVLWEHGPSTIRMRRDWGPDGWLRADTTLPSVLPTLQRVARGGRWRAAVPVDGAPRWRRQFLPPLMRTLITPVLRGRPVGLVAHVMTEAGLATVPTPVVSIRRRRLRWARPRAERAANEPKQIPPP